MNLNTTPTLPELSAIICAVDDNAGHHSLWVDTHGEVFLTLIPEDLTPLGFEQSQFDMKMRCETFNRKAGYVGPAAAKDSIFLAAVFKVLVTGWQGPFPAGRPLYLG